MITELGRFLRELRINHGEILKDMADNLDVSSAFLSAVENGKKKMPDKWFDLLRKQYSLSDDQFEKLKTAVLESSEMLELDLKNASPANKKLAVSLARQFESLDDETSEKILKILKKG